VRVVVAKLPARAVLVALAVVRASHAAVRGWVADLPLRAVEVIVAESRANHAVVRARVAGLPLVAFNVRAAPARKRHAKVGAGVAGLPCVAVILVVARSRLGGANVARGVAYLAVGVARVVASAESRLWPASIAVFVAKLPSLAINVLPALVLDISAFVVGSRTELQRVVAFAVNPAEARLEHARFFSNVARLPCLALLVA